MTPSNDVLVSDALLEDKFVTIWPDHPCLYDVRSVDFRNRDLLQNAMEAIGEQLDQTSISNISCRFQYSIYQAIGYLDYRFATEQMELRELKTCSNIIS